MSASENKSKKPMDQPALTKLLFITWISSLLWGAGIFIAILAFLGAVVAGLLNFFDPPSWTTSGIIIALLGSTAIILSPILLGSIITNNWRKGSIAGLLAILISIVTFLMIWIGDGLINDWVGSWPDQPQFLERIDFSLLSVIGIPACSTILTLVLHTKAFQHRIHELGAGVFIGIALSSISMILLGQNFIRNNNLIHFIWQTPLFIWVSVIYIPELLGGRSNRRNFLVWLFLVLISFCLPLGVVPLFPMD